MGWIVTGIGGGIPWLDSIGGGGGGILELFYS